MHEKSFLEFVPDGGNQPTENVNEGDGNTGKEWKRNEYNRLTSGRRNSTRNEIERKDGKHEGVRKKKDN